MKSLGSISGIKHAFLYIRATKFPQEPDFSAEFNRCGFYLATTHPAKAERRIQSCVVTAKYPGGASNDTGGCRVMTELLTLWVVTHGNWLWVSRGTAKLIEAPFGNGPSLVLVNRFGHCSKKKKYSVVVVVFQMCVCVVFFFTFPLFFYFGCRGCHGWKIAELFSVQFVSIFRWMNNKKTRKNISLFISLLKKKLHFILLRDSV